MLKRRRVNPYCNDNFGISHVIVLLNTSRPQYLIGLSKESHSVRTSAHLPKTHFWRSAIYMPSKLFL
jgi:hypothetical protein